ncbi:glycerate kinase [Roseimarinus sediminis]|uniref:glycerate kinase n=1 Tax=Roseimarinus sediminis TaxID=1610899 RepID=UPI003D193B51
MKILIAPDSFKDCLSASKVATFLAKGIASVSHKTEIKTMPLSDGGEGFVDALTTALGAEKVSCMLADPLLRPIQASYAIHHKSQTAIIEMAAASGLELLQAAERNPLITSSYGTGQLMRDAINRGCRTLIIGIGGSATNDGGSGMARALGYQFIDKNHLPLNDGGGALQQLDAIIQSEMYPLLSTIRIRAACDVNNPLTGPNGASVVYAPQKGASPDQVVLLDRNLQHLGAIILRDLKKDITQVPGGGAAGGLGAGLVAFAGAELKPGFALVKKLIHLEDAVLAADLVITGEGKIDDQSLNGKTPVEVARLARKHNKQVIAVVGSTGKNHQLATKLFTAVYSLSAKTQSAAESIQDARRLLTEIGKEIGTTYCIE